MYYSRGALVKPWIFKEVVDNSSWLPTTEERVQVLFQFVSYMKEYFGYGISAQAAALKSKCAMKHCRFPSLSLFICLSKKIEGGKSGNEN